jgi:hypothetical protein
LKLQLQKRLTSIARLSEGRYTLELPATESPEHLIQQLATHGVRVVSLNPIRTTLEDYFVSTVRTAAPRDTSSISA